MNWVGGIRNRVRLKQEKKLQKEFFERKRLQKKLNINNPTSVKATKSRSNTASTSQAQTISQDLLALQVIVQTHDKPHRGYNGIRLPTKVDLDRPHRCKPKFANEEIFDLPLPSSAQPSRLELCEASDRVHRPKTPTNRRHQKEATVNSTKKVDSYDSYKSDSDVPAKQKIFQPNQNRHVGYFQNPTKYREFLQGLESNQDKQQAEYSFHQGKGTESTAGSCTFGFSTAPSFHQNKQNIGCSEAERSRTVDSFHRKQTMPSASVHIQGNDIKRKIDSFGMTNFDEVKRSREAESFLSQQRSTPARYKGEEMHLISKQNSPKKQKRPRRTPKHRKIEDQSPFIPFAAPAPYSLAARSNTYVDDRQDYYPASQKSDCTRSCSTPQRLTLCSPPDNNYKGDHESLNTMDMYDQPILHNVVEKLVLDECIQSNKSDYNINGTMENTDYVLPSPATNDVTIECLNKSDPHSFLTDLHLLDELIPENKEQPVTANPDEIMNKVTLSSQHSGGGASINKTRPAEDIGKRIIISGKQPLGEMVRGEQNRTRDKKGSVFASEKCSPRRSKHAAEELKEVMAVQQYESSQESSYNSSWSSSGSENCEQKWSSTTSCKLFSRCRTEVQDVRTRVERHNTSLQILPITSTSEKLQNDSQNQVYTLSSNGLKHLSKTREQQDGNHRENASSLSSFRIYPLSRSEEKCTQTSPMESKAVEVNNKLVQCEIWSKHSLASCAEFRLAQDMGSHTDEIHSSTSIKTTKERIEEQHLSTNLCFFDANIAVNSEPIVLKSHDTTDREKNTKIIPEVDINLSEERCKTVGEHNISNKRAQKTPILEISVSTDGLNFNTEMKNYAAQPKITKEPHCQTRNQTLEHVDFSTKNIIANTLLTLTKENALTASQDSHHSELKTRIADVQATGQSSNEQNISRNKSNSKTPPFEITSENAASESEMFRQMHIITPNIKCFQNMESGEQYSTQRDTVTPVETTRETTTTERTVKEIKSIKSADKNRMSTPRPTTESPYSNNGQSQNTNTFNETHKSSTNCNEPDATSIPWDKAPMSSSETRNTTTFADTRVISLNEKHKLPNETDNIRSIEEMTPIVVMRQVDLVLHEMVKKISPG